MTMLHRSDNDHPVKGFLDLPTELRLEIYGHLLIARARQYHPSTLPGVHIRPKRLSDWLPDLTSMSGLEGVRRIRHPLIQRWGLIIPSRLWPAILRTCKKIHDETAPILYGENDFHFTLPDRGASSGPCRTKPAEELRLRSQCLWLFGYRRDAWHTLCFEMQASIFAHFLYNIGKENTASLRTLRLFIERDYGGREDGPMLGQTMNVVMQLLKLHVSGLRDLLIVLTDGTLFSYWCLNESDEESEREEQLRGLRRPTWTSYPPPETVLYGILKEAAPKLSGLKNLKFRGFGSEPYVKKGLQQLEATTRSR